MTMKQHNCLHMAQSIQLAAAQTIHRRKCLEKVKTCLPALHLDNPTMSVEKKVSSY
jgi:hypothetical protein